MAGVGKKNRDDLRLCVPVSDVVGDELRVEYRSGKSSSKIKDDGMLKTI
jgi:hypothetical protein